MEQETLKVTTGYSTRVELGQLVLSNRGWRADGVTLVVGRPGLSNVTKKLNLGDAVLFETPDDGLLEVRVLTADYSSAEVLVTRVASRPGIAGGLSDADPSNLPFTPDELKRIEKSLDSIRLQIGQRSDVSPEQLDLISRKLAYIQAASERLGRKDWILLTAGALTNLIVAAAFSPSVAKALLNATNTALQWLFTGALKLLP